MSLVNAIGYRKILSHACHAECARSVFAMGHWRRIYRDCLKHKGLGLGLIHRSEVCIMLVVITKAQGMYESPEKVASVCCQAMRTAMRTHAFQGECSSNGDIIAECLVFIATTSSSLQPPPSVDTFSLLPYATDEIGLVGSLAIILLPLLRISRVEIRESRSTVDFQF